MKIIDFNRKGNVVRFFLGDDKNTEYWGDDWDDAPYEHNAGEVYDEFVKMYADVSFPYDAIVVEPCDGESNSRWSKEDMKKRLVPCIAVLYEPDEDFWDNGFNNVIANDKTKCIYFGDNVEVLDNLPEVYATYKGVKKDDGRCEEPVKKNHINIGEPEYKTKVPLVFEPADMGTTTADIKHDLTEEEAKQVKEYLDSHGIKVDLPKDK